MNCRFTDYSKCMGINIYNGHASWYLRSPSKEIRNSNIFKDGQLTLCDNWAIHGVRPALSFIN